MKISARLLLQAGYNGLHVIFVPPSVMNTLPLAWLHMINKQKGKSCDCHVRPYTCTPFVTLLSASCVISSSRALSGCVSLAQHKELRDLKLDGVRMLLLDDGANPCTFM